MADEISLVCNIQIRVQLNQKPSRLRKNSGSIAWKDAIVDRGCK